MRDVFSDDFLHFQGKPNSSIVINTCARYWAPIPVPSESYLELTAPKGWNSFKTGDSITLMVYNVSDKQIVVDQDFGARVFVFNNDN